MARKSARALWAAKLAGANADLDLSKGPARQQGAGSSARSTGLRKPFLGLVLGVDPSLRGSGLAVLDFQPDRKIVLRCSRTLKLPTRISSTECLGHIAQAVTDMLDAWEIRHLAIEETIYVQNFRTAQIMGTSRGAAIAPAAMRSVPVFEYSPLRIKQAVSGYGRASKEQVAGQMKAILSLDAPLAFDEADAAAVALCHAWSWSEE